jgi:hypothetical protein
MPVMTPFTSDVNFTPTVTSPGSPEAAVVGVAVSLHSDAANAEHAQLNERKIANIDLYIAGGPVIPGAIPVAILI